MEHGITVFDLLSYIQLVHRLLKGQDLREFRALKNNFSNLEILEITLNFCLNNGGVGTMWVTRYKLEGLTSDISERNWIQPTGRPFYIPVHK